MAQDTQLHQLIINKLTTEQYNAAVEAGTIDDTQLYMTTDAPNVVDVKVNGTSVVTGDTANINLGTMANESASDYSKKTVADTLYASKSLETTVSNHTSAKNNPHSVTKSQVGLGNVDNTSDINKPVSTAQQTALNTKVDKVSTASRVYGTDSSGVQTTYSVDSFGKVDDVKVGTNSVVTGKIATLGTMAGENTTSYYNKTEVDGKLSGAMHFKGTKATVADLPSSGQQVGDMWNVTATGANYAWDGSNWDKLSENIDLSGFYTKTESDNRFVNVTGDETISGTKTFNGDRAIFVNGSATTPFIIDPYTTGTVNIGRFDTTTNEFAGNIYFNESGAIGLNGSSVTVPTVASNTDSSGSAVNTAYINGANNNIVHKSGDETIGGTKTFDNGTSQNRIIFQMSDVVLGETDVTANHFTGYKTLDANGTEFANCNSSYRTDGTTSNNFYVVNKKADGTSVSGSLGIYATREGEVYTQAPTVTNINDSSTKIVTTEFINGANNNVVHKTGDETVAGSKTFTDTPFIKKTGEANLNLVNNNIDGVETLTGNNYIYTIGGYAKSFNVSNIRMKRDANGSQITNNVRNYSEGSKHIQSYFTVDGYNDGSGALSFRVDNNGSGDTRTAVNKSLSTASNSTTDTMVPTKGWVNNPNTSTNVVHRSGNETIGGIKTFNGGHMSLLNTTASYADAVSGQSYITFLDKNSKETGYINSYVRSATQASLTIAANNRSTDTTVTSALSLYAEADGRKWATVVSPTEDTTSSTQIDTVGARNTKLANYVTLNTTQTITGQKSFDETIYTGTAKGICIKGTEHNYTIRSYGTGSEGAALLFDNNPNNAAWAANYDGTAIYIGNNTMLPYSVTPATSDNSTRIATTAFVKSQGYITSSGSITGSAAKLTTARTIDGVSFNGSKNINHFVECSTAAATVAKEVDLDGFVLEKGAKITIKFTVTNTANNPTLNVNNTGAVLMRYRNAAFNAGYLSANRFYSFVYDGVYWQLIGDLDTSNNNQIRYSNNIKAASALSSNRFIVGDATGYKEVAENVTFDIDYPILWSNQALSANGTGSNNYSIINGVSINTCINKSSWSGASYSTYYLVLSSLVGKTATIDSTVVTTTVPTTADGKYYIPLGITYSATNGFFNPTDKVLAYIDGAFQEVYNAKANSSLNNLNDDGQMIIDSHNGTISNCILEIPQRLKIELVDGHPVIKSGSKIPMIGSTYSETTLTSDYTINFQTSWQESDGLIFYIPNSGYQQTWGFVAMNRTISGDTLPTGLTGNTYLWFDTVNKVYKGTTDGGRESWTDITVASYPLAAVHFKDGVVTEILKDSDGNDMIFNGAGFIGHHAFVYPGIKALVSDRYNDDGSLKSRRTITNSLQILELGGTGTAKDWYVRLYSNGIVSNGRYREYNTIEDIDVTGGVGCYIKNQNAVITANTLAQTWYTPLINFTCGNETVTDFTIRQPVKLVTTEMLSDLDIDIESQLALKANDADVVHKTGSETVGGVKTFNDNVNANTSVTVGQHAVMSYNSTTEALEFNFV